jgi:hypothetical protein
VHLKDVANGQTYAQVSSLALKDPTDTKLAGEVPTLFRGETLRGLLLNAYGWWTVGSHALYAAIGLTIAAFAVLAAFAFEIADWRIGERRATKGSPSVVDAARGRVTY